MPLSYPLSGVRGQVTLPHTVLGVYAGDDTEPTTLGNFYQWSADILRDTLDVSSWSDEDALGNPSSARTRIGGMMHLVGRANGWLESSRLVLDPEYPADTYHNGINRPSCSIAAGFELIAKIGAVTNHSLSFSGIVSSFYMESPKAGVCRFNLTFESGSEITVNTHADA